MSVPPPANSLAALSGVRFAFGDHAVFKDVSLHLPQRKISVVVGPSGCGKSTLLSLLGGRLRPSAGAVSFAGAPLPEDAEDLLALRRRMGMLFQHSALLTDLSVFDNVAFPMREQTDMSCALVRRLVEMKLGSVGLSSAAGLFPAQLSGGMARRVALARAIALDPDLVMYDEPFVGLDAISKAAIVRLIRDLHAAIGSTALIVTHDIPEGLSIAEHVIVLGGNGAVLFEGSPEAARRCADPLVQQLIRAGADSTDQTDQTDPSDQPDPSAEPAQSDPSAPPHPSDWLARLGARALGGLSRTGRWLLFLPPLLTGALRGVKHPDWLAAQLVSLGVRSMSIVVVAGLFVGMALGLQGYHQLAEFGAESDLGVVVALFMVRELGPVLAALLFAGRAGSALTSEIGLMRATEQFAAMEMMAVNPVVRVLGPRFMAGIIAMPLLAAMMSAVGVFGGLLIGHNQFGLDPGIYWESMRGVVDWTGDVLHGVIKSCVFGALVTWVALFEGYTARPTSAGVSRAVTRAVVISSLAVLGGDYILTALLFEAS